MRNNLDKEEKELLKSFEKGEWSRIPNHDLELEKFKEIAAEFLKKNERKSDNFNERVL